MLSSKDYQPRVRVVNLEGSKCDVEGSDWVDEGKQGEEASAVGERKGQ